jgi:hypothetical protein
MRTALCIATLIAAATVHAAPNELPAAATAPVLTGPEASIPFVNHGGIYNFHAANDQGIWLQTRRGQWYYGKFFAPCTGIQFAQALGFVAGATGSLDRWSTLFSRGTGRCNLTSLRTSEAPPGWGDSKKAKPDPR